MNLPDSIEQLTTEKQNDTFLQKANISSLDITDVIYSIKQKLSPADAKAFDEGIVYFKQTQDEGALLKNILNIYRDVIIRSIKKSNMDDSIKDAMCTSYKSLFANIAEICTAQTQLLQSLSNNKKNIDINEISYIILGYAIDIVKKISNRA